MQNSDDSNDTPADVGASGATTCRLAEREDPDRLRPSAPARTGFMTEEQERERKAGDDVLSAKLSRVATPSTPLQRVPKIGTSIVDDEPIHFGPLEAPSFQLRSFLHRPIKPRLDISQSPEMRVFNCRKLHRKIIAIRRFNMLRLARAKWMRTQNGGGQRQAPPNAQASPHAGAPNPRNAGAGGTPVRMRASHPISKTVSAQEVTLPLRVVSAPVSRFIPPKVPDPGIYNILNNYNPSSLVPYLKFLRTLRPADDSIQPGKMQHKPVQPSQHFREMNAWLESLLGSRRPYPLFRRMKPPEKDDHSALARCVRFARSQAQERLSWAVHPVYVALIVERTNWYGIECAPRDTRRT